MSLRSLSLLNFRNHKNSQYSFREAITVITGKNGIGKTTILEAVSLLGSGKSFRPAKTTDFVRFNENFLALRAKASHDGLESDLALEVKEGRRRIEVNGKGIKLLRNLHSILPCVAFSPADHKIVDGDAADRRFFLNHALATFDYEYADILAEFNKGLAQRNKLLKRAKELGQGLNQIEAELESWDELLARAAVKLIYKRQDYCRLLDDTAAIEYRSISTKTDRFLLIYDDASNLLEFSGQFDPENQQKILLRKWKDTLRLDMALGTTSVGPHKDDLRLTLGGNELKFYGSQGEKRTAVLALRLAEVALLKVKQNLKPILLVDDVSSELDSDRRQALVELLRREDQQVLMTATELPSTLVGAMERPYEHINLSIGE